jgi:cobalamin biosynthetic protein CobC
MRDHGGNIDVALKRFGGRLEDWIDLSTGINRRPYPAGELPLRSWTALPSRAELEVLHEAARDAYRTTAPVLAVAGAQAAIQMLPYLAAPGRARILAPTYNEYSPTLAAAGWQVEEVAEIDALAGADLAVVVNPNNPDGQAHDSGVLLALVSRVKRLVIDESFADVVPELSLSGEAARPGLLILRSFGKFYGLAGLRLGFALGAEREIAAMAAVAGPWPVSIAIGQRRRARASRATLRDWTTWRGLSVGS